jgi:hypothetical protein
MPRSPRHKSQSATYYHLYNRVAGDPKYFPFHKRSVARKFVSLFQFYLRLYFCHLAAFKLMGNHYHSVVFFEQFRKLRREELEYRAQLRFGQSWQLKTANWSQARWEQFNHDLFDVSRFMQHVNGEFAKWFNRRYGRRGHFWADRFKNPELLTLQAVQRAILYSELNAVRAGLVQRPENYKMGSANWRWANKKTDLLIPLEQLFPVQMGQSSFTTYRAMLYYAGAVPSKKSQAVISEALVRCERERGFSRPGFLRRRLRFFTDGVAIGSRREIKAILEKYRERGLYKRRRNPIPQLGGTMFSLREQRSHA